MDKILAFIPTLLSYIATATTVVPSVVTAVEGLISAVTKVLPAQTQKLDVKWLQTTLSSLGFDPGTIDGSWGSKTQDAVKAYQAARGLVVDGWAGVTTTASLLADLKKK
jgi:peptidoglycan hydrolase-like protein with peptidoglycan-binding domain